MSKRIITNVFALLFFITLTLTAASLDSLKALQGMGRASITACDIDTNGTMDICLLGNSYYPYNTTAVKSMVYSRYSNTYTTRGTGIVGVEYGASAWGGLQ